MLQNVQESLIWDKIDSEGSVFRPTSREGHVFLHMPDKNEYLLFGGISHTRYSDVSVFSVKEKKWGTVKPIGEIPKELSHCVGWYDSPYFFIHGGRNKELSLSDTYFLDTEKWTWRKVFTMEQPSPRYQHAVAKGEGKEAYIFGGYDEKRNRYLGDLHRYEYKILKITPTENDKVGGSSWISIHDSGTKPTARRGHSIVYYKGSLILYGGMTKKGLDDENIYKYTIETRQWKTVTVSGVKPGFRVFHTMNFFTEDSLIIFGGKIRKAENLEDYNVTNDLISLDLVEFNCSTPFIANVCPSPRFGHASAFNSNFAEPLHLIIGGLDQSYCPNDVYVVRQITITNDKKWVYEPKKMHSSQVDSKDAIFEIAKKTIIGYKKQLEDLGARSIEVNRTYGEQFSILNSYKKSLLEEDLSINEKKTKQIQEKNKIESDKRTLTNEAKELKEYNNLLNTQLKINREKFLLLSEFLEDCIDDVRFMDEIICTVDKHPNKYLLFSNVDIDALSYKRKNYKLEMDSFKIILKDSSLYEKSLYEQIQKNQEDQKIKFKRDYNISTEDRQTLSFREREELSDDSLEHGV